jgi:3-phosphoshikimate 1-carboxyvinyltransferase
VAATTVIHPARSLAGSITVPGDQWVSHYYAIIAALADGTSKLENFSNGAGPHATLDALRAFGVGIDENGSEVTIRGIGLDPRLASLEKGTKASVLLGGMFRDGETLLNEPARTPDHFELALRYFGARLTADRRTITLRGRSRLAARDVVIPGDLSMAAYFLVAALLVRGSDLYLKNVGLNPTRSAFLDLVSSGGADLRIESVAQVNAELIGDIRIRYSSFRGGAVESAASVELPALAVLAAASEEGVSFRDPIPPSVTDNLRRMGIRVEPSFIPGGQTFRAADFDSNGDEPVAMACAAAALAAEGPCSISHAPSTRFAEFATILSQITGSE